MVTPMEVRDHLKEEPGQRLSGLCLRLNRTKGGTIQQVRKAVQAAEDQNLVSYDSGGCYHAC